MITTLLVKITTIITKKKRMMMKGKLILPRKVRRLQVLIDLTSIAAILIINFLNYNFKPRTTTSTMAISEKERMFVC